MSSNSATFVFRREILCYVWLFAEIYLSTPLAGRPYLACLNFSTLIVKIPLVAGTSSNVIPNLLQFKSTWQSNYCVS